jgi:hypothetical protein
MKIHRIHSLTLKDVKLEPKKSLCFMHDYEFLGIDIADIQAEMEGQCMLVYTGDFSSAVRFGKCPWCGQQGLDQLHINKVHDKSAVNLHQYKFQIELYRERLRLLRAGKIDHTYFVYMNVQCQFCDFEQKRGRGLCSIPESARNKTRSLTAMGFSASNFPAIFLEKPNLGYLIGKPL